jgi:predicted transcriptional regulator
VLDVLNQEGQALTAGEVSRRLTDAGAGKLAYSTVVTILSRLRDQGFLDRSRVGRAYAYEVVADQVKLAARRMRRVLDAEHDRDAVLAHFVDDLSVHDERLLRDLLGADLDVPRE